MPRTSRASPCITTLTTRQHSTQPGLLCVVDTLQSPPLLNSQEDVPNVGRKKVEIPGMRDQATPGESCSRLVTNWLGVTADILQYQVVINKLCNCGTVVPSQVFSFSDGGVETHRGGLCAQPHARGSTKRKHLRVCLEEPG